MVLKKPTIIVSVRLDKTSLEHVQAFRREERRTRAAMLAILVEEAIDHRLQLKREQES